VYRFGIGIGTSRSKSQDQHDYVIAFASLYYALIHSRIILCTLFVIDIVYVRTIAFIIILFMTVYFRGPDWRPRGAVTPIAVRHDGRRITNNFRNVRPAGRRAALYIIIIK